MRLQNSGGGFLLLGRVDGGGVRRREGGGVRRKGGR